MEFLPEEELAEFARDLTRTFLAAAELGQWSIVKPLVYGWRSTAYIYASPELAEKLKGPFNDDFGPVPPPWEVSEDASETR